MVLLDLGARSTFLVDLEFTELDRLATKIRSKAIFLDLELCRSLTNTPKLIT
jgi:hypothetical protein